MNSQVASSPNGIEMSNKNINTVVPLVADIRLSFVMIVLNGMPLIEYTLQAIYNDAHEIIIVEGAVERCMFAANPDGSSNDGTVECIKNFPDPAKKIRLIQGRWPEKCEMQNAALPFVTGNYVWLVDSDEIYKHQDIQKIRELLSKDPTITQVNFIPDCFWKGFDRIFVSRCFFEHPVHYRRLFKFVNGAKFTTHRPPTLVWPGESRNTEQMKLVDGFVTRGMGIILYHYSYVFDSQVDQKIELYRRYGWGEGWKVDLERWYHEFFTRWTPENSQELEKLYPIWTGDPKSYSVPFTGTHPEIIMRFMDHNPSMIKSGKTLNLMMHNVIKAVEEILYTFILEPNVQAVETGTIRSYDEHHESTLHISRTLGNRGNLISVDLSPDAIRISRDICKNADNVEWVTSDSVTFLKGPAQHKRFHFALLDSLNDPELIFEEFTLIAPLMVENGILMVDDAGIRPDKQGFDGTAARKGHNVWQFLEGNSIPYEIRETPAGHGTQIKIAFNAQNRRLILDNLPSLTVPQAIHNPLSTGKKHILWIRTDSIGDNVLAMSMLPHIKDKYPQSYISVLCQQHIAELYEQSPFVDNIITFNKALAYTNESYRNIIISKLQSLNADHVLNSVFSREPLTDIFSLDSGAKETIALNGDFANLMTESFRSQSNPLYSTVIPNNGEYKLELERHGDFLQALGIISPKLQPVIWTTSEDVAFAENFFRENRFDPERTIALFAGALSDVRTYEKYGAALKTICEENGFSVVALGSQKDYQINQTNLDGLISIKAINICGKTTLRQSAEILRRCKLAVGAETSMAHIACAVGTRNVVLLGGGHFGRFMPYSPLTSAVSLPLECFGCDWCCRCERVHCVKDISHEVIEEAVRRTLASHSGKSRVFLQGEDIWERTANSPTWKLSDKTFPGISADLIAVSKNELKMQRKKMNHMTSRENIAVSAIVSTYNSEEFIRECLEDLESQTIADRLEIIVIDAASPRNERAIVEEFQGRFGNITYVRTNERVGVYAAWNMAIKIARGEYITPFSTNDRLRKESYDILKRALDDNPEVMLVYGDTYLTHKPHETFENHCRAGAFQWPEYSFEYLLRHCCIGPHPMWRKTVHDQIGYFDENYVAIGDQEFWLRMGEKYRMLHIPEFTGLYWVSPEGLSNNREIADPETAEIHAKYQNRYQSRLESRGARDDLIDSHVSSVPGHSPVITGKYSQVTSLLAEGKTESAISLLEVILNTNPEYAPAHNDLGVLHYRNGSKDKALHHYQTAVRLAPENINFRKNLADYYFVEMGRTDDAILIYSEILKENPEDIETLNSLGLISVAVGRPDEAKTFFGKVINLEPWNSQVRQALEELGKDGFAKCAEPADNNKPYVIARKLAEEGRTEEAILELERLLAGNYADGLAHNDLGVLYSHLGNFEKSIEHHEFAVKHDPENANFRKNLANLYYASAGKTDEAIDLFAEIIKEYPDDVDALSALAIICAKNDRPDEARIFLGKVIEAEPENFYARSLLSELEPDGTGGFFLPGR